MVIDITYLANSANSDFLLKFERVKASTIIKSMVALELTSGESDGVSNTILGVGVCGALALGTGLICKKRKHTENY